MTIGDIRWVDLPPRGGHAQSGRRPAIIVQSQSFLDRIPTVLVIPLTSQLDALRFPGTVLVGADTQNGLRRASVTLAFLIDRTRPALPKRSSGQGYGECHK